MIDLDTVETKNNKSTEKPFELTPPTPGKVVGSATTSPDAQESEERLAKLADQKEREKERKRIKRLAAKEERAKLQPSDDLPRIDFEPVAEAVTSLLCSLLPNLEKTEATKEEKKMIAQGLEMTTKQHTEAVSKYFPYAFLAMGVGLFMMHRWKKPQRILEDRPAPGDPDGIIRPDLIPDHLKKKGNQ